MATHSNILTWKIQWTEGPGRLQSMGSQSQTELSDFIFTLHFIPFTQAKNNYNNKIYSKTDMFRKTHFV